jgi:hypothetical protein
VSELWASLLRLIGIGRNAVDGYDKLTKRLVDRLDLAEQRLDKCDEDRAELRSHITDLTIRVERCDADRDELKRRVETLEEKTT